MEKTGHDYDNNGKRIENIPNTGTLTGNYSIDFQGCWWECIPDSGESNFWMIGEYPDEMNLTAEQIAKATEETTGLRTTRIINRIYRLQDCSNLWPINNRYNLTEYAISKAQLLQRQSGKVYGLEYCYLLENIMSEKVNKIQGTPILEMP